MITFHAKLMHTMRSLVYVLLKNNHSNRYSVVNRILLDYAVQVTI